MSSISCSASVWWSFTTTGSVKNLSHYCAVADKKIQEMEIASLLLVNRLFTQSCLMQIYSMKDLLLSQEQIGSFDRATDIKEIMETEKKRIKD